MSARPRSGSSGAGSGARRVRSTTQRWRPRRSERSTPRRAMRGVIDRSRIRFGSGGGRRPCPRGASSGGNGVGPGCAARPGRRRGRRPACGCRAGWPRSAQSRAACPLRRRRGGALCPGAPGPGSGTRAPLLRGLSIEARPSSASAAARAAPVQFAQHARGVPVAQPAPARHARAAERLPRQHRPWDARPQEHDALQGCAVVAAGSSALRLWGFGRQQRLHRRPQLIVHKRSHGPPTHQGQVLLQPLRAVRG